MTRLSPGDLAPDFEAVTDEGTPLRLSDLRGKPVVLYFYPKDNTPGCTTQSCAFRDSHAEFEARDAVVLGVSPDGVASHQEFKSKYSMPFRLLVDEDHQIAEAYGAWGEKSLYGRKYLGIIRSHFVIGADGRIQDAQYKVSPKQSTPLALKALAGA